MPIQYPITAKIPGRIGVTWSLGILSSGLSHSISLSTRLLKQSSMASPMKPLAHIFHNAEFPPGVNIKAFKWWTDKGLYRIGHFFTTTGPITLTYCQNTLEKPDSEKFRFTQISHFLHSIWRNNLNSLSITPYEHWCANIQDQKGGISLIYSALMTKSDKPVYTKSWEEETD